MSAVYMINGKPFQMCGCDQSTPLCSRIGQRELDTCGFRRCMVPAENVVVVRWCDVTYQHPPHYGCDGSAAIDATLAAAPKPDVDAVVAELDALYAKAAKGPWHRGFDNKIDASQKGVLSSSGVNVTYNVINVCALNGKLLAFVMDKADLALIIALVNAWPKLRAALAQGEKC